MVHCHLCRFRPLTSIITVYTYIYIYKVQWKYVWMLKSWVFISGCRSLLSCNIFKAVSAHVSYKFSPIWFSHRSRPEVRYCFHIYSVTGKSHIKVFKTLSSLQMYLVWMFSLLKFQNHKVFEQFCSNNLTPYGFFWSITRGKKKKLSDGESGFVNDSGQRWE